MINVKSTRRYCCENIETIENYQLAVTDESQTWDLHHRLEITEMQSVADLIFLHLYYHRPASELIFLTHSDHIILHMTGVNCSEETRLKRSESLKGINS